MVERELRDTIRELDAFGFRYKGNRDIDEAVLALRTKLLAQLKGAETVQIETARAARRPRLKTV